MTSTVPAPSATVGEAPTDSLSLQLQAFAGELQRLRSDAHAAEMRLFRRASEIESQVPSKTWEEFYGSFEVFLRRFSICSPARYRGFLSAVEQPDVEAVADRIGVGATIQAGKIDDPKRRAKMLEAALERVTEKKAPWSDAEALRTRLRIGGAEPKDSAWNQRHSERELLQLENLELKKRLLSYEEEVAALQEENMRLRKERPLPPNKPPRG